MGYEFSFAYAAHQDEADALRAFRSRYLIPRHRGIEQIYFTGNSLGLQPAGVEAAVKQELDSWAAWGVEGHFRGERPWYAYHEEASNLLAPVVGALQSEVVAMNHLTVNLHLLLVSFYRPSGKRRKILFEHKPFPSDHYAFESHVRWHGLDPSEVLVELQPRPGEHLLRPSDILGRIAELEGELALVCMGGVNYFTGQYFDLEAIVHAAHQVGAHCGFDLAHAAGNVPLRLHDWNVDFACWCSYKYLNSGPGGVAGAFIHERHHRDASLLRLAGWWGHNKQTRFEMAPGFDPIPTAEGWQLSNAPVLSLAAHRAALELFQEAGMEALREKSVRLTGFLEFVLDEVSRLSGSEIIILTPQNAGERGCQLSVRFPGATRSLVDRLSERGVTVDWREPDVIRLAPVPMYNSYRDIVSFGEILLSIL